MPVTASSLGRLSLEARQQDALSPGEPLVPAYSEALRLWERRALPSRAVVLTIDDGWYGTYKHMAPVLEQKGCRDGEDDSAALKRVRRPY